MLCFAGVPKPIKLYTSGTVVKGTASGGFEGEGTSQIFDGTLPATIYLDAIVDPNAWSPTADLTWSGMVMNNNTIKGTFSLPATIMNGTQQISKTYIGQFELELMFKWNGNLDIVIPNKVYHCKAIFLAPYKSSMNDDSNAVAQSTTKQATDPTVETCNVLFQGTFYEKSFFCYITPWWCTDEKLFYWNGGLEFKITKPAPPPTAAPVTSSPNSIVNKNLKNTLNAEPAPGDMAPVVIGAKILGKVANGWVTINNDAGTTTVWDGTLPAQISLSSVFFDSDDSPANSVPGASDRKATWTCSVFSNSLRGTFKIPQVNSLGLTKYVTGSFFFLLELSPTDALNNVLESGVEYSSPLGFRSSSQVFNGTQIIPINSYNPSIGFSTLGYKAPIILLGMVDKASKTFSWDGRFEMIAKKDTKKVLGDDAPSMPSPGGENTDMEKPAGVPILGSNLKAGSPVVVGSKLIGRVSSGWVTLKDDAGTKTIWNGELPAAITAPMFYNPTTNLSDLSDEYGHGAVWSCSVFHTSLRGSFSLPQYTNFGLVKWIKGSFYFQIESDPSWSLFDAVYPGVNYKSPIHFRSSDKPYNGSKLIQFISHEDIAGAEALGFIAPVILQGRFDKVSKAFTWDGRFEMIIKKDYGSATKSPASNGDQLELVTKKPNPVLRSGKPMEQAQLDATIVGSKILGKVASGWITVSDDSGTKTIWNGELPASVNAPMFYNPTNDMSDLTDEYGHGAVWSASVFHSTLKGSFKLPQYTKFGLVKWLKGRFYFQLETSPQWSLYDAVVPGISYYSPIHFRTAGKAFNDTQIINLYSSQTSPMDDLGFRAPIVLLGSGVSGKGKGAKSFTWDGRFVMVIKKFF